MWIGGRLDCVTGRMGNPAGALGMAKTLYHCGPASWQRGPMTRFNAGLRLQEVPRPRILLTPTRV